MYYSEIPRDAGCRVSGHVCDHGASQAWQCSPFSFWVKAEVTETGAGIIGEGRAFLDESVRRTPSSPRPVARATATWTGLWPDA